ncbi:hypothetical protein JCM8097_006789 [Rhodosporidiobolus ruineniae]
MTATLSDALAHSALATYTSLPPKGKPSRRSNGQREWTILAAFLVFRSTGTTCDEGFDVRCVSLGTGLKALPHYKLPLHGDVLHDSHAEVIARRGFKLWLYGQVERAGRGDPEALVEAVEGEDGTREWQLKGGWKVGMYVSTLPCGDASTYLLALQAAGTGESGANPTSLAPPVTSTSTPVNGSAALHPSLSAALSLGLNLSRSSSCPLSPSPAPSPFSAPTVLRGRLSYTALSSLRTKPGRADSPPTTSHSCSDKLALWNLLGVQGGLLSAMGVRRIGVELLVVGSEGVPPDEEEREKVRKEIERAVGGRLEPWAKKLGLSEEEFRVLRVEWTDRAFEHGREEVARQEGVGKEAVVSCAESLSWVATASPAVEVITNGIRQGAASKRKAGEALGAKNRSRLSKLSLFQRHAEVEALFSPSPHSGNPSAPVTYFSTKHPPLPPSASRSAVLAPSPSSSPAKPLTPGQRYQRLKGLVRYRRLPGDSEAGGRADVGDAVAEEPGAAREGGPFAGWLVSGGRWESFDVSGRVVR